MKKFVAIIILICVSITGLSSCINDHYTFSETRDFAEYSPYFEFFPKSVENAEVLCFGDAAYDYWSHSDDVFLVLKFNDKSTFEKELERIYELKDKYDNMQMENYLVNGYDCLFLMCSYSTGKEENIDKYIRARYNEFYYGISWDLVMISELEMTIVYNFLRYDTRNFEKWEEREAYISEYFDLDLEALAKELDEG
jgi:hypothetical protein